MQPVYHYGGRSYTVQQVKVDLANRFERYKTHDATLASLRDIQTARRKSLDAARQKLEGMLDATPQAGSRRREPRSPVQDGAKSPRP